MSVLFFSAFSCKIELTSGLKISGFPPKDNLVKCNNCDTILPKCNFFVIAHCLGPPGCKTPPPLEDGDTVVIIKQEYEHNEKVQYVCQQSYVMEGGPYKICKNGAWTGDIRCLKSCTVNTAEMNTRNIEFAYSDKNKLYAPHNGHLTFSCKRGTRKVGSEPMRRKCTNGQMNLPTCQ
uniref:Sushi domain-containing protein n=1 Tax=Kryptolebias marmoratus TaxID=37003 RepID=A0A3Q3EWR6_KRYMA